MWQAQINPLASGKTLSITLRYRQEPLSYATVIQLWQQDDAFRSFFNALLANAPFSAFFWETPPITIDTVHQSFQCVLVDSLSLTQARADGSAFYRHFQTAGENNLVLTFANLGKDATLIVPCPVAVASVYPHLATFSRRAPAVQQQALWQQVGETLERQLNSQPIWLSTSGLGVLWLHVRLDSRPKYYSFAPYRAFPVTCS